MASKKLTKQGEKTKKLILTWLFEFKFSTAKILAQVAELKQPATSIALNKLEQKGLLVSIKPNPSLPPIWGITWQGICEIGETDEKAKFQPSKFNDLTATHQLNLQQLKLLLKPKAELITIKRTNIGKKGKIPDGIYHLGDDKIAVELERRIKSKLRYQQIWGEYAIQFRKGETQGVHYFLPSTQSLGLEKIFDQTKTILIDGKKAEFTPEIKNKFNFSNITDKV